jgi:hypothetical protein
MIHEYTYDIRAFHWDNKTRTFSQDAWNLEWMDDECDPRAFPNMKEPFYIKNFKTGESRLFTFSGEKYGDWIFWNALDNITCMIGVDPF